ncbi:unnamed protein product, partial [Prorocentrum cordatum]
AGDFLATAVPDAERTLVQNAVRFLAEKGFTAGWQVASAPKDFSLEILKPDTAPGELTLAICAQQAERNHEQRGRDTALEQTFQQIVRSQQANARAQRRMRRDRRDVSSSSGEAAEPVDGEFDAVSCLSRYGIPGVEHGHQRDHESLRATIRAVRRAARGRPEQRRWFLCREPLEKWAPQWMTIKPTGKTMTHAQWVACFWSRGLAQLTAQSASEQETVSMQALLRLFLNMNQADFWSDAAERSRRRDQTCVPEKDLCLVDENRKAKARNHIQAHHQQDQSPRQPYQAQRPAQTPQLALTDRPRPPPPPSGRLALARWRAGAERLQAWRASLSACQVGVLGRLGPFLMGEMLAEACHPDEGYILDLLNGFPLTEVLGVWGLGTDLPGGRCSRARPGWPGPRPLPELRSQCAELNSQALRAAEARRPRTEGDLALAAEIWHKLQADIAAGRAGPACEISDVDLSTVLVVESFGIWESRGDGNKKARDIHHFRKNLVNDCAWMPQTFHYDTHDHMFEALTCIAEAAGESEIAPHVLVPLFSHVFGDIGAAAGWFRTAQALKSIAVALFALPVLFYVDDVFWAATGAMLPNGRPVAQWIADVFNEVVCSMLGWELDPRMTIVARSLPLLGPLATVEGGVASWRLGEEKRGQWCEEIREVLGPGHLSPGRASKLCGKLAFLNSRVFNRLGRALLRPLIWRQCQFRGPTALTRRIRHSPQWFMDVLALGLRRSAPHLPPPAPPPILVHSDAEGIGRVGAGAVLSGVDIRFLRGRVPRGIRKQLLGRTTNIIAYELLAAVASICSLCPADLRGRRVVHFVDNQTAVACIIRGFSTKRDLAAITGRLWFDAAAMNMQCEVRYVASKANLADPPSRDDISILQEPGAVELPEWSPPHFGTGLDSWARSTHEAHRLLL